MRWRLVAPHLSVELTSIMEFQSRRDTWVEFCANAI
jgi:hypothetical protein